MASFEPFRCIELAGVGTLTSLSDMLDFAVWPHEIGELGSRKHLLVEGYPAIVRTDEDAEETNEDQRDANALARWLHEQDAQDALDAHLAGDWPAFLMVGDRQTMAERVAFEGWILGA